MLTVPDPARPELRLEHERGDRHHYRSSLARSRERGRYSRSWLPTVVRQWERGALWHAVAGSARRR
jgi:hypothetical protein